jgi:hypothetical protein
MPEPINLFFSIVFGMFGVAYVMYGKRQGDLFFILSGMGLMGYTFLVDSTAAVIWVGAALVIIPFILSRYL